MSIVAPYSLETRSRWSMPVVIVSIVLVVALSVVIGYRTLILPASTTTSYAFYTLEPMDLNIVIRKDGELQAVNNLDVVCPVEGQNTITTIVEEGTAVKKGQVICELDSSELRRKIQQAILDVKRSEAESTAAREQLAIQESKNAADLAAAEVELRLAKLDLREYTEGTHPAKLAEAKRAVNMSKIALQDKEQALAEQRGLLAREFVTYSDVKKAEVEVLTAQNDLLKKETDLKVLVEYTHEKELADKQNKLAQAEGKLSRTELENNSNFAQKKSESQNKEQALTVHKQTLEHLEKQLAACTITAPGDGILVYGSTAAQYYRESPIQAGARIYEQQLLARVPDTSQMKVTAKIQETQALMLRVDKEKPLKAVVHIAGVAEPISASVSNISVLPDNSNRWWNPDSEEYPVDLTLAKTPPGLKPGLTAKVEIYVEQLRNVLAVPMGAIYSVDAHSYVFVRQKGDKIEPVKVVVAKTNDTHAQVSGELKRGMELVLLEFGQGRQILEAAGIKTAEPKPSDEAAPPAETPAPQQTATALNN
jgi:HlyD family secretion protein